MFQTASFARTHLVLFYSVDVMRRQCRPCTGGFWCLLDRKQCIWLWL